METRCHCGDNRGATGGKLYLRHDSAHFNVSFLLTSMLTSKDYYTHKSGKFTKEYSSALERFFIPPNLSLF